MVRYPAISRLGRLSGRSELGQQGIGACWEFRREEQSPHYFFFRAGGGGGGLTSQVPLGSHPELFRALSRAAR